MEEATLARVKLYASWIAACVGAILAYFSGFDLILKFVSSQDAQHIAANIYIVVFTAIVAFLAAWRQWITIRKEKYANITPILHSVHHEIRDLNTFIHLNEPKDGSKADYDHFIKDCKIMFGSILDRLKEVFTSLTSTHCRTSIKLTYEKNGNVYVYTLTRDQGTKQKCFQRDNARLDNDHDALEDNVQFAKLFNGNVLVWHYICNDLTCDNNFRGTSVTAYDPDFAKKAPTTKSFLARLWWNPWPLPYKSTVACVIRQGPFEMNQKIKAEVLGFLTVDSESRGVFEERWDTQLMFAVADALYGPIRGYIAAQNRAKLVN